MKHILLITALLISTSTAFAIDYNKFPSKITKYPALNSWPICKGKKAAMAYCVIDGDSLRVNYRNHRIGELDTPETRRYKCPEEKALGLKAKQETFNFINSGEEIEIETFTDPLTKQEVTDKYGRVLANVYVDGMDLATHLINKKLAYKYDGGKKENWCLY